MLEVFRLCYHLPIKNHGGTSEKSLECFATNLEFKNLEYWNWSFWNIAELSLKKNWLEVCMNHDTVILRYIRVHIHVWLCI